MQVWQILHFQFKFSEPPIPPLAINRIAIDNYFSIAKARQELGYVPPYTTTTAAVECIPAYREQFLKMKAAASLRK